MANNDWLKILARANSRKVDKIPPGYMVNTPDSRNSGSFREMAALQAEEEMTIPFPDALALIKRIVREHPEPKMDPQCLDEMRPSDELFCPSMEFMRDEFFPFWREFVDRNEISGGKWFCEGMANFACGVMSQCARIRAEKTGQDYAAAFFKAGIWIYKPIFNGGLESGPHMTNLVILSDGRVMIWEPQNPKLEYVELKEALHSVDLVTVAF